MSCNGSDLFNFVLNSSQQTYLKHPYNWEVMSSESYWLIEGGSLTFLLYLLDIKLWNSMRNPYSFVSIARILKTQVSFKQLLHVHIPHSRCVGNVTSSFSQFGLLLSHFFPVYPVTQSQMNTLTPSLHVLLFWHGLLTFTLVSSISGHAVACESIDAIFTCPVILTRITESIDAVFTCPVILTRVTYFHTCIQYIRPRRRRWIHWRHLCMSRYSDTDYLHTR